MESRVRATACRLYYTRVPSRPHARDAQTNTHWVQEPPCKVEAVPKSGASGSTRAKAEAASVAKGNIGICKGLILCIQARSWPEGPKKASCYAPLVPLPSYPLHAHIARLQDLQEEKNTNRYSVVALCGIAFAAVPFPSSPPAVVFSLGFRSRHETLRPVVPPTPSWPPSQPPDVKENEWPPAG